MENLESRSDSRLNVLWAVDGSSHAAYAVSLLRELVLPVTATLSVITVAPRATISGARPDPAFVANITQSSRSRALAEADSTAGSALASLGALTSTKALAFSRWGHPIDEILNVAAEAKADLIVMGAHSHSNLHALLLGSVAEAVVKRSTRPVLIARPQMGKVDRVLVSYDGSPAARNAVRFVGRLANPRSCEFILVNAVPPFVVPAGTPLAYRRMATREAHEINKQRERHAEREVAAAVALSAKSGRHVAAEVAWGDAARILVEVARTENADLVVVGSDGTGTQNHGDSGGTAEILARHSPTSVLIVR